MANLMAKFLSICLILGIRTVFHLCVFVRSVFFAVVTIMIRRVNLFELVIVVQKCLLVRNRHFGSDV